MDDGATAKHLADLLGGGRADRPDAALLDRIHARLDSLAALLDEVDGEWVAGDLVYRFWHHSFKCYTLQEYTERIVVELRAAGGDLALHEWFESIVAGGCGKTFELSHNKDWLEHAKPIVDAFFHARHMLAMVVHSGRTLETAPNLLPSSWAAVLELYQIR